MRILGGPTIFIVAGIWCLWIAASGKTVYYGTLGVMKRPRSKRPMPPLQGRLTFGFMGAVFLFVAIWSLLHPK
jgi:hypothetical protein